MKKCTSKTGRHSWRHLSNFIQQSYCGNSIRFTKKGTYECKNCGLKKIGKPQ